MSFIDELKKTKEGQRAFEKERVLYEATEIIALAMEEEGLSKADLARRLGTHKSYITQLLSGKENMTLAKVSDVLFELKKRIQLIVEPMAAEMEQIRTPPMSNEVPLVIDLPPAQDDYWAAVTDLACPCGNGTIRWAEAGYVPGYRICDGCGRHWEATGNAQAPQLVRARDRDGDLQRGGPVAEQLMAHRRPT